MRKKGVGSLEFVLAFVLFVGFTVAVLYFFNPISTLKNMDYSRDYTFGKIIENTSVQLDSYSIVVNNSFTDQKIKFTLSGISPIKKTYTTDYNGTFLNSSRTGNDIFCVSMKTQKFFEMYLSEDIPLPATGTAICNGTQAECDAGDTLKCKCLSGHSWCCPACLNGVYAPGWTTNTGCGIDVCQGISSPSETPRDYQIASSLTDKVISETRVIGLAHEYDDYNKLKEQLNIPPDVDFSFSLVFPDKTTASNSAVDITREVYSETRRVEVLRTTGRPQFGELTVSVW